MSFTRTNRNINAAAAAGYTAEQLFGVVIDLIRDVYDEEGVKKASALPVNDQKKLLTTMHSLSKVLVDVYAQNRDGLADFVDEEFREEIAQRAEEIRTREAELTGIAGEIAEEEKKQSRLNQLLEETTSRRGHLLSVKEECDAIQGRIDQLNDTALDDMAARKVTMEAELTQRQARADALSQEQASIQTSLDELDARMQTLKAEIKAARVRYEALMAEEASAREEKARLEKSIEAVRVQLEEARRNIGDVPALSERIKAEYQEIQIQLTAMFNAVNSARDDAFLAGNLFVHSGGITLDPKDVPDREIAKRKFNDWDELEVWFAELEQRIQDLLEVFGATLKALVKQAESITAWQDEK